MIIINHEYSHFFQNNLFVSPSARDEPHIRIACNGTYCAYRLKEGDTLLLRHDQIEQTRYRPEPPLTDETKPPETPDHP